MTGAQVIVVATPVFLVLIALEFAVGWARGRHTHRLANALTSIGLHVRVFEHLAPWRLPADSAWVWFGALLACDFCDFCDYGRHRAGHRVALIDLLYEFWVRTQQIGRLGWFDRWFDRWFVSPSNHRVHHAVNERYLDRNYGGILVICGRLFGTFQEEARAGENSAERARQAQGLGDAIRLATGRRGGAVPEAGLRDQPGTAS